jgi:hypothetical protein
VRFAVCAVTASAYLHIIAQIAPFASALFYDFEPPNEKTRLALSGAGLEANPHLGPPPEWGRMIIR